ncbi:MAG: small subunit ribosomal protein, partial [Actinomycetota bacterium]|nr:small subunit ribosomal protein [Actinomycetota bacterium]
DIGLRGFLPASLVEMRRVRDLQPYVGKQLECRIIELDKNRNNVVLSRRKFLEESQAEQRQDFLTSLAKGERRTGVVSSIVNFGAFVDLGGVDGLVHVSELSWKHVDHPSEVVEVGQEVEVEVLDVDLERERVSLSLKATQEDPWRQFARKHEIGDVIEGRVTKLVPFGAFVEVDDAIEGLVHISELAEHHVERAEEEVSVHDKVEVRIIDIDLDRRRISLSRKQALRPTSGAIPEAEGGGVREAAPPRDEAGYGPTPTAEEAEMEIEAHDASEDAGVSTEDTIVRPESGAELESAAEEAGDLMGVASAPESASDPWVAGESAPAEEEEEAELTSMMYADSPPEGHEGLTASEDDKPNMNVRLNQEEPEEGAGPGDSIGELDREELQVVPEDRAESEGGEQLEPEDVDPEDDSLESIVEDLKRTRGQARPPTG